MRLSVHFKKSFSVLCLLAFASREARAAVFTVNNTDGAAALGSYGFAMGSANSMAATTDTIAFDGSFITPQSITLTQSASAVAKNAGAGFTMNAPSLLTINAGTFSALTVSGGGTFNVQNVAINGSSAAGIGVDGATTILRTNQGFSTGLTLANGGTLGFTSGVAAVGAVALSGGGAVEVAAGQSATLAGVVSGTGGFTKTGAGTLVLNSGSNTYAGGTTVNGGTLAVAADGALGGAGGGLTLNGGTLRTNASFTMARGVVLQGAGGTIDTGGSSLTAAGVISGAGALTKNGAGVLTLGGNNSYFGGTTVNTGTLAVASDAALGNGLLSLAGGTTFQTNGGLTSNRPISLGGAVTVQTQGNSSTYNGSISGAGTLTFSGGGTQTLGGFNSHAGTTVNTGVLAISNDAALGLAAGTLTLNNATLRTSGSFGSVRNVLFNGGTTLEIMGGAASFSGSIGGSGGLIKSGGGTLILNGSNTYNGGTTVNGGVLAVSGDGALGQSGSPLTLNNATLQAMGSLVSNRGLLLSGNSTIEILAGESSLSGVIGGGGTFRKAGSGTLLLSGGNNYSGGTFVDGGTLRLSSGASLATGTLSTAAGATFDMDDAGQAFTAVANAGTIDTGAGTVTASSYAGGGTLLVLLQSAGPNLDVSGTANLSGGTLRVGGRPASGLYTVVDAGTLTGTFSSVLYPAGKTGTLNYTGTGLSLNLVTFSALQQPGLHPDLSGLAGLFDDAASSSSGDLDDVIMDLNALSGADQARALAQISPLWCDAMTGGSLAGARAQAKAVERRMAGLRDGDRFAAFSTPPSVFQVADAPGDGTPYFGGGDQNASPWGFFASLLGATGDRDADGFRPGYSFSSAGVTLGVDRRFSDAFSAGVSLGTLSGSADVSDDGGSVDNKSFRYGLYGTASRGPWWAGMYLGGAADAYDSQRRVAALSRTATASPDGQEINWDLKAGYALKKGLTLTAGLSHDRLTIDSFTETGAGALNLTVGGQKVESLRSALGAKVSRPIAKGSLTFTPQAGLEWLHEFKDQGRAIDASLASLGAFRTETADLSRDAALIGLGLRAGWTDGFSAALSYTAEFRSSFNSSTFFAHLRKSF